MKRFSAIATVVLIIGLVTAWGPWGGGGASVWPGGGAVQGIPTSLVYAPPTYGTATSWVADAGVLANQVEIPANPATPTGLWYLPSGTCTTGSIQPSWPPGYGATVTDGTCTWTATGSTQPIPAVWQKVFDFDFTAPGSTTFTSDGSTAFGGFNWVKFNSANEATHASAGGGSPLTFKPTSTAAFGGSGGTTARGAPGLWLSLAQLNIPGLSIGTPLRAWVYFTNATTTGTTVGTGGNGIIVAYLPQSSCTTNDRYWVQNTITAWGSVSGWQWDEQTWFNATAFATGGPLFANNAPFHASTLMYELSRGLRSPTATLYFGNGLGPWPGFPALVPVGMWADTTSTNLIENGFINQTTANWTPAVDGGTMPSTFINAAQFGIGIMCGGGTTGFTCAINRMRVDYKPVDE